MSMSGSALDLSHGGRDGEDGTGEGAKSIGIGMINIHIDVIRVGIVETII